jgi:hypothetical protein
MSHFAKVENGIVTHVIVAEQDFIDSGAVGDPSLWVQTSYNTRQNVHYDPVTALPSGKPPFRGNYAGIGCVYDLVNDVFYPPQPYPSWVLSKEKWDWDAPTPCPEDGNRYDWDEEGQKWVEVPTVIDQTD